MPKKFTDDEVGALTMFAVHLTSIMKEVEPIVRIHKDDPQYVQKVIRDAIREAL